MSAQFIRKCSLIVYGQGSIGQSPPSSPGALGPDGTPLIEVSPAPALPGMELGQFRIQFRVAAMDVDAPPTAIIRVLNLASSTVQQIQQEFQNVVLQAGYEGGNFGVIFQGSIIRTRVGRLNNIETFLDIMASNFDAVYNYGVVSRTLAAGADARTIASGIQQAVSTSPAAQASPNALQAGMSYGSIPNSFGTGGTLPRGKVMFGLAREKLRDLAETNSCTWSVGPDGRVNIIPLNNYLQSGLAVAINADTGMIGVPEATQSGIEVRTLLNPLIVLGTAIQLDNDSINTTLNNSAVGFPSYSSFAFFANTNTDGTYRALVVEHEGYTRGSGDDWLTKITALSIDASGSGGAGSVSPYGYT